MINVQFFSNIGMWLSAESFVYYAFYIRIIEVMNLVSDLETVENIYILINMFLHLEHAKQRMFPLPRHMSQVHVSESPSSNNAVVHRTHL